MSLAKRESPQPSLHIIPVCTCIKELRSSLKSFALWAPWLTARSISSEAQSSWSVAQWMMCHPTCNRAMSIRRYAFHTFTGIQPTLCIMSVCIKVSLPVPKSITTVVSHSIMFREPNQSCDALLYSEEALKKAI